MCGPIRFIALMGALALGHALGCSSNTAAPDPSGASGSTVTAGNAGHTSSGAAGGVTQSGGHGGKPSNAGTGQLESGAGGDAASAGAGGAKPAQPCTAETPQACRRGLYLSLYADHSGKIVFDGETAQHLEILDDPAKQQSLLDFIEARGIDSLSLYDLATILDDVELKSALVGFVAAARLRGVSEVNAIGSLSKLAWDTIAATQLEHRLFDGLVTEIEFWNQSASFEELQDIVGYVRDLDIQTADARELPLAVYIGRATSEQFTALLPLVDGLFVHVYVKSAEQAYGYGAERFSAIAAGNDALATNVDVRPIFSAEGQDWAAGDEHFMGDWLATHSLEDAESTFLTGWDSEVTPLPPLTGFQYYDYFFLERYLQ